MEYELQEIFYDINDIFINRLQEFEVTINDFIEIELFNDCIETYKRAYRLVNNKRILDGIVLTRNAFELMMMFFGIRIDENVRKEYCKENSYECYLERKKINKKEKDYLSQSYLRKIILKKYNNIEEDYNKIYNTFSKFAHPTIHRNMLRFFEKERSNVIFLYLNAIMVLPILFLEIFSEENTTNSKVFQDLVIFKYIIEMLTINYIIKYVDENKIKEVNKYAFWDINRDYYNAMETVMKKELEEIESELTDNRNKYKQEIEKVLSKLEYYNITKKLVNFINMMQ